MKANEAPEKIYLHIRPNKEIGSTWHGNKISDNDVEYTRTDAFIEKAWEWLEPVLKNHAGYYAGEDILGDFRNYMKGVKYENRSI